MSDMQNGYAVAVLAIQNRRADNTRGPPEKKRKTTALMHPHGRGSPLRRRIVVRSLEKCGPLFPPLRVPSQVTPFCGQQQQQGQGLTESRQGQPLTLRWISMLIERQGGLNGWQGRHLRAPLHLPRFSPVPSCQSTNLTHGNRQGRSHQCCACHASTLYPFLLLFVSAPSLPRPHVVLRSTAHVPSSPHPRPAASALGLCWLWCRLAGWLVWLGWAGWRWAGAGAALFSPSFPFSPPSLLSRAVLHRHSSPASSLESTFLLSSILLPSFFPFPSPLLLMF